MVMTLKCILQEEVSSASDLVDQLQAALEVAKSQGSSSSAELVAGLQAELERQAGVIGELRTQLRASTEAQEDLRRQTVSLAEAQAHMAEQAARIEEGPPAAVARMQAQLLEKVSCLTLLTSSSRIMTRIIMTSQIRTQAQAHMAQQAVRIEEAPPQLLLACKQA